MTTSPSWPVRDRATPSAGTPDANKALAARYHTVLYDQGDDVAAGELLTPDFVAHGTGYPPAGLRGRDAVLADAASFRAAFSSVRLTIEFSFADADRVAQHWSLRTTRVADMSEVTARGVDVFRVEEGRLAEVWEYWSFTSRGGGCGCSAHAY